MKEVSLKYMRIVGGALVALLVPPCLAQPNELETLTAIADYAERICNKLPLEGSSKQFSISGEAEVELQKLLKYLADLRVSGAASFKDDSYVGLVREQLGDLFLSNANCKERVSGRLEAKLILDKQSSKESKSPTQRASISIAYPGDYYGCNLPVSISIGDQTFYPQGRIFQASNIELGQQKYQINGQINCLYIGSCLVQGEGTINIIPNRTYHLFWQNVAIGQCTAVLQ